ncbi:carbon-nitrogen hydrolase family protein [Cryobacterium melibiosiphilum]|uniref:carbon-nitrogen hydrolase family protein n=1 Tax=Cryobacterium melibiosiphilum TaxID=995039 RepID=UPI0022782120|nr:carbon-nitrogen hydrolase family protein [Cryobacterium melibiosiphilum]
MTSTAGTAESPIAVAVAQFCPGTNEQCNLRAMTILATTAAERGARLVVFPEYSAFFEPVLGPGCVAAAQPLDGTFVTAIAGLAAELDIAIVAGMLESTAVAGRFSNTLVAVDPRHGLVATYRKQHLYDAFGQRESDWVLPGPIEAPHTFRVGDLTVGMQTCYDIRFPEVTRRLVDAGVDLVLVPAEWVRGPLKEQHWRTLLTARAVENTVYLAAADQAPPVGVGNSMILDPMGVELVTIGETTDVAVAWLSGDRLRTVRAQNPALQLRRFRVVER